jgi:hypothetical protein
MIKIDKAIPMPVTLRNGRPCVYPWAEMEIGDSFFVSHKTKRSFGTQVYQAAKRLGKSFALREETHGVRVWRTE